MSDVHDIVRTVSTAGALSAPPVGVTIWWVWISHNLPVFVAPATLIYLALQSYLVWLKIRELRRHETGHYTRTSSDE